MKKEKVRFYLFEYNFVNIYSFCLILTLFFVLLTVGIYNFCGFNFIKEIDGIKEWFTGSKFVLLFVAMSFWMVLHEIIHGISYIVNGANVKNIKYGVALEKGILYCKCGQYIGKKNICWSVINPFIYIGVVTLICGFVFESFLLIVLSLINISGACADIVMFFFFIKKDKDMEFKEIKDSSTFILKTSEDLTKRKFFAVKLKEVLEKDEFKENDRLITLSNGSKWMLIILGIILLLFLLVLFI